MRFLQSLLVASLVSIGIGVALYLSTVSMPVELLTADVTGPSAPPEDGDGETPDAAVAGPVAFTATREEVAAEAEDGDAAEEGDAADDDANGAPSHDADRLEVTIRGSVVDAERGEPLANVSVESKDKDVELAAPVRTDSGGSFVIVGWAEQRIPVTVVASSPGFVPIRKVCAVEFDAGCVGENLIRLRRGCQVVGRIDSTATIRPSDVTLSVSYEEVDGDGEAFADSWSVRADGSFVIDSVVPGSLVVLNALVEGRARGATLPIRVPPDAGAVVSADIPLVARPSCTIKLDPPGPEDYVALRRIDRGEPFRSNHLPDPDGSYRFADLPAGRYEVRLNSFEVDAEGRLVDGVPLGTLELAPGEDHEIEFARPQTRRVSGQILEAEKVVLGFRCGHWRTTLTLERPGIRLHTESRDGQFCFPSVPPGRYRLTADVDCEPLEVEAGEEGAQLREIGRGAVGGLVVCGAGVRPDATLTNSNGDACESIGCSLEQSADGVWRFDFNRCGPGPLRLEVVASGHRLFTQILREPLATERLDVGTIHLEPERAIVGTVVDDHDRPLADLEVHAIRELVGRGKDRYGGRLSEETAESATDEYGRFELPFEPRLMAFDASLPDGERVRLPFAAAGVSPLLRIPRLHALHATIVTELGRPACDVRVCVTSPTGDLHSGRNWLGEASTDANGRCTIETHGTGLVELTSLTADLGRELDVDPFTLESDLDLGTLVLRR